MVNWSLTKVPWSFNGEKEVFQEMVWNNWINMLEGEFLCLNTKIAIWDMNNDLKCTWLHGTVLLKSLLPPYDPLLVLLPCTHRKLKVTRNGKKKINDYMLYVIELILWYMFAAKKKKKGSFFNVYLERDQSY